jgi:hypothetical protein
MAKKKVIKQKKKARRYFDTEPKKTAYYAQKKEAVSYEQFVNDIKTYVDSSNDEYWLYALDDDSEFFKQYYKYAINLYDGAESFIEDYITPLTDFIWRILVDTGNSEDIDINELVELLSWYIEDFYKRGANSYTDSEKEIVLNSDVYQRLYGNDLPQIEPPKIDDINTDDIGDFPTFYKFLKQDNSNYWNDNEEFARYIYDGIIKTPDDPSGEYVDLFGNWYDDNKSQLQRLYDGQTSTIDEYGNIVGYIPSGKTEDNTDEYAKDLADLLEDPLYKPSEPTDPSDTAQKLADMLTNKEKEDLRQLQEEDENTRYSGTTYKLYDDPSTLNGAYMYYYKNDDGTYTGVYNAGGSGDKWAIIPNYTPYSNNTEITQSNYTKIYGLPDDVYDKFYSEDTTIEDMKGFTLPPLEDNTKIQPSIVEGEGLDSATTEALPVGRNPATTTNRLFYDPKYDSMGVKNSDYYYYVNDSGQKVMYLYDNINNVFQLVSNDWTASTTGMNEINEDTYQNYNFLPDELYNKFDTTEETVEPTDTAVDYTSDDYIEFSTVQIPKYLGNNQSILEGDNYDSFSQSLYDLYTQSDAVSAKRFLVDFRSVQQQITNYAYDNNGYEFPDQKTLDQTAIDYFKNYGYTSTVDPNNLSYGENGVSVISTNQGGVDLNNTILPAPQEGVIYSTLDPSTGKYLILQMDDTGTVNVLDSDLSQSEMLAKYPDSTQITYDDWDKMTTLQDDTSNDTGRELSDYPAGKYSVKNDDGTYTIIQKNNDGSTTVISDNVSSQKYQNINTAEVKELTQDQYNSLVNPDADAVDGADNTDGTEVAVVSNQDLVAQNLQFEITASNAQINNNINIMQQTDNMGVVDFRYESEPVLYPLYANTTDDKKVEIHTFNGEPFYRTNYEQNSPITANEWAFITDSFEIDRNDFDFQNVESYFFEMAVKYGQDFYNWLDEKNLEETGLSFFEYISSKNGYARRLDIKEGVVKERTKGINSFYSNSGKEGDTKKHTQEKIKDTETLGIENPATYILSASSCCMFSIMIMDNIKRLSNIPLISGFEASINTGDFKNINDVLYAGMYKEGSAIRNIIESDTQINANLKNILRAIFSQRTYKTLSEFRTANRFAQQIISFFGKTDERVHVLDEHNNGKILFNIGLVCLSYFSSFMGNDTASGFDTDTKSNLLKVISTFLEVVYPAEKYDGRLISEINNIVSLFNNEIIFIPKNTQTQNGTEEMLRDVIYKFLTIVVDNTETSFMVQDLFDKNTFASMISLFNLEIFRQTNNIESLTTFLVGGVIDSTSYNLAVKKMMITTLGEKFELDGIILHDVLFMEDSHAHIFLNNPKYNLIIPIIHPEVVGAIPDVRVYVNMIGFDVPITGLILKQVEGDFYQDEIEDDIKEVLINPEDENVYPDEKNAVDRVNIINEQAGETLLTGVEQTPEGFKAGISDNERAKAYDAMTPIELKPLKTIHQSFLDAKFDDAGKLILKKEPTTTVKIVEDKEDYTTPPDVFDLPSKEDNTNDWMDADIIKLANDFYDSSVDEFKNEFLKKFPNWKDDSLRIQISNNEDTEMSEIISIKNEDKNIIYLLFRGSKTVGDWLNNFKVKPFDYPLLNLVPINALDNLLNYRKNKYEVFRDKDFDITKLLGEDEDIDDLISQGLYENLQGHLGFKINNFRHLDFISDIIKNRLNEKSDIRLISHSRGNALGTYFLNILATKGYKPSNIKYRSFGGVSWLYGADSDRVSERLKDFNIINYYTSFDPLRMVNYFTPFYGIGNDYIISYDFKLAVDAFLSSHYVDTYKTLLSQKSKIEIAYRKKSDDILNKKNIQYLLPVAGLAYAGYKAVKEINNMGLDMDTNIFSRDIEEGTDSERTPLLDTIPLTNVGVNPTNPTPRVDRSTTAPLANVDVVPNLITPPRYGRGMFAVPVGEVEQLERRPLIVN